MLFQSFTIISLAALSIAAPTPYKRALEIRKSGPVLADTTYNDISIAGGQAGNAQAEALAVFSALDLQNPENIDPADIKFLNKVNNVANKAEDGAFNTAVAAATGDAAAQIQNGKIKNKVLKLTASTIALKANQAQGEDVAAKLADETKKLNNNIAIDTKNAGQTSIAEPFDGAISGGGKIAAAKKIARDVAVVDATDDADADDEHSTADDVVDADEAEYDF
ncbi:hypothetical protein EJ02DRAFT_469076 [Clathrospora elynae]|uniref:Small secreted protein n=1 Tax=Clathrospora elynae TaxID=706981 RepID=A0A6A5SI54_9PLEO|nr:hypothetical protein EJ02DRAFT_469076 [Clathrospora elynae]